NALYVNQHDRRRRFGRPLCGLSTLCSWRVLHDWWLSGSHIKWKWHSGCLGSEWLLYQQLWARIQLASQWPVWFEQRRHLQLDLQ
ncbi:hypothetical protein FBU31_007061, partial [Coemansia sp. 'formosensis']